MNFSELPSGARFRFFSRGLLHVKVSSTSYEPVTGGSPGSSSPDLVGACRLVEDDRHINVIRCGLSGSFVNRTTSSTSELGRLNDCSLEARLTT